jgi:lipopolysaccharide transport system permease protein
MLETTYTPDPQLASPARFLAGMRADVASGRVLGWRLAVRNIRGQYRRSRFGYLWAFLPIIITTGIWVALNASGMLAVRATGIPYPAFVLVNITLWQGFVDALFSPLQQMNASRGILAKVSFARESLIVAGVIEVLFTLGLRTILLLLGLLWFRVPLPVTALLAPVAMLTLVLLGTTLGVLLLPLGVLYDDVNRGLLIAVSLWLFVTPVVYPPPTTWPLVLVAYLNPVTPLLVTSRELLTTGVVTHPGVFAGVTLLSLVAGLGAWVLYRLSVPHLISRMSS